jgi:hypothetical protein
MRVLNEEQSKSMSDLMFNLCALTYLGVVLEYAIGEGGNLYLVGIGLCAMAFFAALGLFFRGGRKWKRF